MTLRMTTSPSPTTTNFEPAFKPRAFRTSSGMTTSPFDDIFVVALVRIALSPVLTSKKIYPILLFGKSWWRALKPAYGCRVRCGGGLCGARLAVGRERLA